MTFSQGQEFKAAIVSKISTVFAFSHIKADVSKTDTGQGHPRVVMLANYDGLGSPMLHTKFRGNRQTGSGEEDFEGFLPYMGMAAILVT